MASAEAALSPGLYGVSSSDPGAIYSINTATGQATLVQSMSLPVTHHGVDFANGTLFTTNVQLGLFDFRMGSVDPDTGAFTELWDQDGIDEVNALAYDPGTNRFFATFSEPSIGFAIVDGTTGTDSFFPSNQFISGLAYDTNSGVLYGSDAASLFTIDITTGTATLVGALGAGLGAEDPTGLAYDPVTDTLYLNAGGASQSLFLVDPTTGAATLVGANSVGAEIDGIGFLVGPTESAIPEPVTALGFGGALAAVGLALTRRARRA